MVGTRDMLAKIPVGHAIPHVLHQHFFAGESAIPQPIRSVRDALRAANPGWSYRFWDAARAEKWIGDTYGPKILAQFMRIRPEYYAARSDLLRYLSLYAEGGVYLDIKSTCDLPLDEAILPADRFVLTPWDVDQRGNAHHPELRHVETGEYVQWVLASVPGHPILRAVILRVLRNIDAYSEWRFSTGKHATLRVTGPIAYTLAVEEIRADHPHTLLSGPGERGFRYSGLERGDAHFNLSGAHYSAIRNPMIDPPLTTRMLQYGVRKVRSLGLSADAFARIRNALFPERNVHERSEKQASRDKHAPK